MVNGRSGRVLSVPFVSPAHRRSTERIAVFEQPVSLQAQSTNGVHRLDLKVVPEALAFLCGKHVVYDGEKIRLQCEARGERHGAGIAASVRVVVRKPPDTVLWAKGFASRRFQMSDAARVTLQSESFMVFDEVLGAEARDALWNYFQLQPFQRVDALGMQGQWPLEDSGVLRGPTVGWNQRWDAQYPTKTPIDSLMR